MNILIIISILLLLFGISITIVGLLLLLFNNDIIRSSINWSGFLILLGLLLLIGSIVFLSLGKEKR